MQRVNWAIVSQIHVGNTFFTGDMQVRVIVTRQKYHSPRHMQIWYGCDNFYTYLVVVSLSATTSSGRLDVQRHVMTLEALVEY